MCLAQQLCLLGKELGSYSSCLPVTGYTFPQRMFFPSDVVLVPQRQLSGGKGSCEMLPDSLTASGMVRVAVRSGI